MEIRETMKKGVIFTVKGCYRSICNHPFLVGMMCFLVYLYSSFPFLFSLLVSGFPVIVCTAILLGTLLSFGKPNIPEIEREERTTYEVVSLQTAVSENNVVLDRGESVFVERYGDKGKSVVGALIRESSNVEGEISGVGSDGGFGDLLEEMSKEREFGVGDREERSGEFVDLELESKSEMFGERLGDISIVENHYSLIPEVDDEHIDLENDRSPTCSVDSKMVNVDCLDSPPCTPWRHVNHEDDENEDDEGLDSGSDRAESSSPDASLADILPVLDELHPLLDEGAPHLVNLSHDGSDASSEQSARSDESSNESDDDTETQVSEVAENDNEVGEDEEETHQEEEEDQTKSPIRWTEEDERNLMDLGSSELERNQRLENLIARRRARKTMSVLTETNLIDLESTDFTFSVPPILTTRHNPFDVSQNSYEDMGLPPIPGSAPSVLLHRRNPFDIPYDSSEEKPDLMEDSFQQEFTPLQSKDHFFRRHESFNSWRTPFGINRAEKQDMSRFRPYFVEDRLGSEGTSFLPFQRQLSGISDSKASSVPDTGSISSSENTEEWNVTGEETSAIEDGNNVEDEWNLTGQETSAIEVGNNVDDERNVTREETSAIEYENNVDDEWNVTGEETSAIEDEDNVEDQITRELDLTAIHELASELAGHGSESSEEENSIELHQVETIPMKDDETERKLEDIGYHQEAESSRGVEQILDNQFETSLTETYSNVEAHEQGYRSISSSSSLSEESERIYIEKEVEELPSFIEEPIISAQPSLQSLHLNITTPSRDDVFNRNPVYDLSPSVAKGTFSRSSSASDQAASGIDLEPAGVKKSVSFSDRVTLIGSQEIVSDGSSEMIRVDESQMASSSDVHYEFAEDNKISVGDMTSGVPETEIISGGYMEITERDDVKYHISESDGISAGSTSSVVPETVLDHIAKPSSGSSYDLMYEDVTYPHSTSVDTDTNVIQSSSMSLNETNLAVSTDEIDSADSHGLHSVFMPTAGEWNLVGSKKELESEYFERAFPAPLNVDRSNHTTEEESVLPEKSLFQSTFDRPDHEDETLTSSTHQFPSAESSGSMSVEEMGLSQNSFNRSPPDDHKKTQISEISVVEPVFSSTADSWNNYDISQIDHKLPLDIEIPTSPEATAVPAEVLQFQSVELTGIDEHLLAELDAVGDFRVKEFGGFDDPVVDAKELASTIKEFDQYVEDTKHVSELERSVVDPIDPLKFDGIGLDYSGHLQSKEDKIYSEAKQTDIEVNSLADISDIEENDSVMAEIEAHFAKTIEDMIIKAELTSAKTGVVHIDPPPSFVDLAVVETSTADSESMETGRTLGEPNIHMETQVSKDLSINQPQEDDVEQVMVSGTVLTVDGAKEIEGTFLELLVSESQSLSDPDSALKQESRRSSSEELGFSENRTAEDVQADLDSRRESRSGVEESDVVKTLQHSSEESDIVEAKTPESDDVLIPERKSLDDSFSTPKQESHSSPSEALKMSEDVRADMDSPRESKSGVEESDAMKSQQHSLEESDIVEAKTPERDDVILSERNYFNHSFSAPKQESQSSPNEALKTSEDVPGAICSPSEPISGAKDSDVEITQQNSVQEEKPSESHDVRISERHSPNDSDSTLKKESQSSPSEASKLPEDKSAENVRADVNPPRSANPGIAESDVGNDIKEADKKSSSSSSSSSDSDKE